MTRGIHWFRQDLRLADNTALAALGERATQWLPVFVLDPRLAPGSARQSQRLRFLLDCLAKLAGDLEARGVPLLVREGRPEGVLPRLLYETGATLLSFNEDTTPFARSRDRAVRRAVLRTGARVISGVDRVVYSVREILSQGGRPYSVYTPYRNAWRRRWNEAPRLPVRARVLPPIQGVGGDPLPQAAIASDVRLPTGGEAAARRRLAHFLEHSVACYGEHRDRPDRDGTSRLSPYLRFGAISVRECFASGRGGRARRARAARAASRSGWTS